MKYYWLYVLKLENEKYYVGVTSLTPEIRMKQHKEGVRAAAWTRKYKPLQLMDQKVLGQMIYSEAQKYENKVVRAYMNKYGFNNVRGGDLSSTGNFIKRFGWYIDENNWETITVVIFLILLIVFLLIKNGF